MKIVLHAEKNDGHRRRLEIIIKNTFPKGEIILTDNNPQLSEVLCRPLHNVAVLIAFITDSDSVDRLFSLKPLCENIKTILIFCKKADEIQQSMLLLEPVYTSHCEDDFQDIISVLKRIKQKTMRPD